jgi:hypothetical protein
VTAGIGRRRTLVFLAITTVAIGIVLAVLDGRMRDSGGPGIVGFEFAGSEERAAEILADWGEEGEDAARASLWLDYVYILSYTGFLTLAAIATRDLAATRGWWRMAAAGVAVIPMAAAAGALAARRRRRTSFTEPDDQTGKSRYRPTRR